MGVLTSLGVLASYSWAMSVAKQISVFHVKFMHSFLRRFSNEWVLLCIADNYVKLSKNHVKTHNQSLMLAVATIMYAFYWLPLAP